MPRPLDPILLQHFVAVCDEGSIARAAEREALVGSALSKRIAALEAEVGVELLVRRPQGALARRPSLAYADTLGEPSISVSPGGQLDQLLRQQAAQLGRLPAYRMQVSSLDAAFRMVAAGLGMALLPLEAAAAHAGAGQIALVPLSDAWALRRFVLVTRTAAPPRSGVSTGGGGTSAWARLEQVLGQRARRHAGDRIGREQPQRIELQFLGHRHAGELAAIERVLHVAQRQQREHRFAARRCHRSDERARHQRMRARRALETLRDLVAAAARRGLRRCQHPGLATERFPVGLAPAQQRVHGPQTATKRSSSSGLSFAGYEATAWGGISGPKGLPAHRRWTSCTAR
jgi:hypothetical protein